MKQNEIVFMGAVAAAIAAGAVLMAKPAEVKPIVLTATTAAVESAPAAAPQVAAPPSVEKPLHAYLMTYVRTLKHAYVDRDESAENREARLSSFVDGIVDALEKNDDVPPSFKHLYGVTLVKVAHRETVLARNIRSVGNEDEGLAHGYWQIHEWRKMDPASPVTALDLMVHAPQAWVLPDRTPWVGLPDAANYLRAHPYAP